MRLIIYRHYGLAWYSTNYWFPHSETYFLTLSEGY
jgi:hypothetical protein